MTTAINTPTAQEVSAVIEDAIYLQDDGLNRFHGGASGTGKENIELTIDGALSQELLASIEDECEENNTAAHEVARNIVQEAVSGKTTNLYTSSCGSYTNQGITVSVSFDSEWGK